MARSALARLAALALLAFPLRAQFEQAGVCSRCHVAQVLEWSASRHPKAGTNCQGCHGASEGHVINERNQVAPDQLPRGAAIAASCAQCHRAGCPKSRRTVDCQSCHHVHALSNPADNRLRQTELPQDPARMEYARRMEAGERLVRAQKWREAQVEFEAAARAVPTNRRAAARARMCVRRLNPAVPGFEILGAETDAETGLPRRVRIAGLGIEMLLVPGGEFELGSDDVRGAAPAHTVRVEPFYLGIHEVTQQQWLALSNENPSVHKGDRLPVHGVSWKDAQAWLERANARVPGGGLRLPTEAEWELAARAAGGGPVEAVAWFRGNSATGAGSREIDGFAPRAVGGKAANALGFFDLQGNVAEWCSSLLRPYPYDARDGRERIDAEGLRVLRGGAYADAADLLHPALRHGERPTRRNLWNGFRVARSEP